MAASALIDTHFTTDWRQNAHFDCWHRFSHTDNNILYHAMQSISPSERIPARLLLLAILHCPYTPNTNIFPPLFWISCVLANTWKKRRMNKIRLTVSRVAIFLMIFSKCCWPKFENQIQRLHKSGLLGAIGMSVRTASQFPQPQCCRRCCCLMPIHTAYSLYLFVFTKHPPRGASLTVSD